MTYEQAEEKIKQLADKEFLAKLVEIAKLYGWHGDYIEIGEFVSELHRYGEMPVPDLEPYRLTE
jgi:hypothetical protein